MCSVHLLITVEYSGVLLVPNLIESECYKSGYKSGGSVL